MSDRVLPKEFLTNLDTLADAYLAPGTRTHSRWHFPIRQRNRYRVGQRHLVKFLVACRRECGLDLDENVDKLETLAPQLWKRQIDRFQLLSI
jgi:hypothetical protein